VRSVTPRSINAEVVARIESAAARVIADLGRMSNTSDLTCGISQRITDGTIWVGLRHRSASRVDVVTFSASDQTLATEDLICVSLCDGWSDLVSDLIADRDPRLAQDWARCLRHGLLLTPDLGTGGQAIWRCAAGETVAVIGEMGPVSDRQT
jgi:hypothetical protein